MLELALRIIKFVFNNVTRPVAKKKDLKEIETKPKMVSSKPIFDKFGIGPEDAQRIMGDFYRDMQQIQDGLELEETLKKPTLTSQEIWTIKPNTFYQWRIKYDLPRILSYFNERLSKFDEWKNEFGINDELLMRHGISNCVDLNDEKDKDKNKYIFFKKGDNSNREFLEYTDLSKKVSIIWGKPETFILKIKFVGYLDWCEKNKITPFPGRTTKNLFEFTSASNIRSNDIKVYILDKLELLKIGGLTVQGDRNSLINPKYFEFVNASFLTFKGLINTAGIILRFVNSVVDDMQCKDLNFSLVDFSNCSLGNLYAINSKISQWNFYKTSITGKISNSSLSRVTIIGGRFNAILDNTFISGVFARHTNELDFISTYQTLKKTYADQGDDKHAIFYFLKEKTLEREALYKAIFNQKIHSSFKISWFRRTLLILKGTTIAAYRFLSSFINNYYWGYGRKPFRVIGWSFIAILLCAILYQFNQDLMNKPAHQTIMNFSDSFYFSAVTFTTLGYGDFTPSGFLRVVTALEAIFGGMSIGFLVAGFANLKY